MPERILDCQLRKLRGRKPLRIVDPDWREGADGAQYGGQDQHDVADGVHRRCRVATEAARCYRPTSRGALGDLLAAVGVRNVRRIAQVNYSRIIELERRRGGGFHDQQAHTPLDSAGNRGRTR